MKMYAHIYICVFICCFPTTEHKTKSLHDTLLQLCNFGGRPIYLNSQILLTQTSKICQMSIPPTDVITLLYVITLIKSYHLLHTPLPQKTIVRKKVLKLIFGSPTNYVFLSLKI